MKVYMIRDKKHWMLEKKWVGKGEGLTGAVHQELRIELLEV
jgi:hypothetical protein